MRLAEIERRIASLAELEQIMGAMRSIASMRAQEALRALASVRAYSESLASAVREALAIAADGKLPDTSPSVPMQPSGARSTDAGETTSIESQSSTRGTDVSLTGRRPHPRRAVVLYASEYGFVGGFNERVLEAAKECLQPDDTLLILGSRGASLAAERGLQAAWSHPMATRLASTPQVIRQLEAALYVRIARGEITRAEVLFERYERGRAPRIEHHQLFPLEGPALQERPARQARPRRMLLPLHNLAPAELLERLAAEFLGARLTEAAVESLASENGARFAAMEAARDNLSRKLGTLRLEGSRARQEEVTTELLDLVTGGQAVER